jgi:hypothetical protein
MRKFHAHLFLHLPSLGSDAAVLATMHLTRTQVQFLNFRLRAYSHAWLTERNLPSALPDELKPKAEQMYPRIVKGVGISVNTTSEFLEDALTPVREAMEQAVLEAAADGKLDDAEHIKQRMSEAQKLEMHKLGLKLGK